MAQLLVARRGNSLRVEAVSDPVDGDANESGVLLPGPDARLAGPPSNNGWRPSIDELDFSIEADRAGPSGGPHICAALSVVCWSGKQTALGRGTAAHLRKDSNDGTT